MNRALEAIVSMSPTVLYYLEYFVVIISAGFTFSHGITSEFHPLYDPDAYTQLGPCGVKPGNRSEFPKSDRRLGNALSQPWSAVSFAVAAM